MQIKKLITQLETTYNGRPFYGKSILKSLEEIPFEKANNAIGDGHSIAQILTHMLIWRNFTIEQMKGNPESNLEAVSKEEWPEVKINSKAEWEDLKNQFEQSHTTIIELLNNQEEEWLDTKITKYQFPIHSFIKGIIQHDIYHLGQVNLLKNQK